MSKNANLNYAHRGPKVIAYYTHVEYVLWRVYVLHMIEFHTHFIPNVTR